MELKKQGDFFTPQHVKCPIHIIGCGAIGSHVAEQLARIGCTNICLYDFDRVEPHNIPNQMFDADDIGALKVDATAVRMTRINPDILVNRYQRGYVLGETRLDGHVFLCVDNIDLRRDIVNEQSLNPDIVSITDFRMGFMDSQVYFADCSEMDDIDRLLATMSFSQEEAQAEVPVTGCGTTLAILPTIRVITALGVSNFIQFCKDPATAKKSIDTNAFVFYIDAFN